MKSNAKRKDTAKRIEKYIIANVRTPRNINYKRLGKDYVDYFYTGKRDMVSYNMEWGYQRNIEKARQYKTKSYAEKIARKINYDCELGDTGNWLDVIPVSFLGNKIDFKK